MAEEGCDAEGIRDTFNSTTKRGSPDLFKEHLSGLHNTEARESLANAVFPVSHESAVPNVVPSLEAVLRPSLHGGPTALSTLETDIRASIPPWMMHLGDTDLCVKPARPDGVHDTLGLTVLGEPALPPPGNDELLLALGTCLPSSGKTEIADSHSSAGRIGNSQTLRQEVGCWVAEVRAHHTRLAECAKAAGLESTSNDMLAYIQRPLGLHLKRALQKQLLFCISELPMLALSVEHLARVVCWLGGVPRLQSVNTPFPELLALFLLCLEEAPAALHTAVCSDDERRLSV